MLSRNARIRAILFSIYVLLYGGFVFANALTPDVMDIQPLDGINLAIVYGLALIIGAFVLAIIYGMLCRPEEVSSSSDQEGQQ